MGIVPLPPQFLFPSVGAALAVARGRGNRRSAVSGGGSEPVSRKCPDWRVRQCPSVGWHDGGQESPSPTHHMLHFVGRGDHTPPFCVAGVRIATGALRPRNDRAFTRSTMGSGTHGSRPTHFVGRGGDTGRCRHRPLQPYVRATKKDRRWAVFFCIYLL